MPYDAAVEARDRWISWARRCRIPSFVKLAESIVKHKARILSRGGHRAALGKKLTHECVRRALKTQDQRRSLIHQAGLADGRCVGIDQRRCTCIASRYRLSMFGEAA